MDHWQRIEAAIAGTATDRVPVALWRHFPVDDQDPGKLAAHTLDWQRAWDFDLVKFMPSGTYGIVMDVKVSSKKERDGRDEKPVVTSDVKKASKQVQEEYKSKMDELREQLTEALSNILLGEKIPLDVVNSETGEIIIPANRKITKTLLRKLAQVYDRIEIDPSPIRNKINEIIGQFKKKFDELQMQHDQEVERAEAGDEVDVGIIKQVKVYIASKRKIQVGDKVPTLSSTQTGVTTGTGVISNINYLETGVLLTVTPRVRDGIGHAAHLGGALMGIAIVCLFWPEAPQRAWEEFVASLPTRF